MQNNLPLRNYNLFYLQGDSETTDMDVVETLGLDPDVAYTPQINDAAIKKMYQENINAYISSGMDEEAARNLAAFHADAARAAVKAAMKEQERDFQL